MVIKINIGVPSQKKTKQIELSEEQSKSLHGLKMGESFKGEKIDLPGFEFEITGGSDSAGFPMRKDTSMAGRRKVLITRGTGNKNTRHGMRLRKTVAGNTVYENTAQLNVKALKEGSNLFEEPKAEEEAPAQE